MKDLIECYLSEQIAEPEWQKLLKETPGLQDAWESHFSPNTIDDMKLVMRTQIANVEDNIKQLRELVYTKISNVFDKKCEKIISDLSLSKSWSSYVNLIAILNEPDEDKSLMNNDGALLPEKA